MKHILCETAICLLLTTCTPFSVQAHEQPDTTVVETAAVSQDVTTMADTTGTPQHNSKLAAKIGEIKRMRTEPVDTANHNWWYLLKKGHLKIDDPAVEWPRGIGWAIKAYNFIDKALNNCDPQYVAGTGKNGKVMLVSDNWTDRYDIHLDTETQIEMLTRPYYAAGIGVSYLGIGYCYKVDLSHIIANRPINHQEHSLGLDCARFSIKYKSLASTGGTRIVAFNQLPEELPEGIKLPYDFSGVDFSQQQLTAYYFFNSSRYSQKAAYSYSKIQLRTAGSFLAGFSVARSNFHFDFSQFPAELKPYLDMKTLDYRFHYLNLSLTGGYGINWVICPNLLFNITGVAGLGMNRTYEDSQDADRKMIAFSTHAMASLSYNTRKWFIGLSGTFDMLQYSTTRYSLNSSIIYGTIQTGVRF